MSKSAPKPVNEVTKDYEVWYEEQVRLGLDDLDAGRMVSSEEAKKHFERTLKQLERKHGTKAA
jgi:predicted transcriptional regulator